MSTTSRRDFLASIGAATLLPLVDADALARHVATLKPRPPRRFRVRTLTAGVSLRNAADIQPVESALASLERAKKSFQEEGYDVETIRVATQPFLSNADSSARRDSLADLRALDGLAAARGALLSLGPVLTADEADSELAPWVAELVRTTRATSVSVVVASPQGGVHRRAAGAAAEVILAIANATRGGAGNFRFAAAANVPAGTPFFPVAHHSGPLSLAVGLESANLVRDAFVDAKSPDGAGRRLREVMESELTAVERVAARIARRERRMYLGIDSSPAPAKDASIGAAIEAFTRVPFGSATTLQACAVITDVLKSLGVRSCGYAGLMLPVLEDPVLAQRATEGRYGLRELLLYSSVCGTGLDVVPLPGDSSVTTLTGVITDVAVLAAKLRKPLSARLFVVPGKRAGEVAHFDDPLLTDSAVFTLD